MTTLFAEEALLPEGWSNNVLIEIDADGYIIGIDTNKSGPMGEAQTVAGPLIPGMPNAHTQSFQRAMAGLVERAAGKKESFWSWRETMYRFLAQIGPDDIGAIAMQLYVEMLKSGYTSVGEFHYIHHQPGGAPYDDLLEVSHHVISAAGKAGIGMTFMPVLYAYGGFGGQAASPAQKRFLCEPAQVLDMVARLRKSHKDNPQIRIGLAPHSLRAVSPEMLKEVVAGMFKIDADAPIHIHAAGMIAEVEACVEWSGKRPVEWLAENAQLDQRWTLIHATNISGAEISALSKTGAIAGLCPSSEANMGGGIFPLAACLEEGGRFAIGSDSNISVDPFEELRWLEYGQRLIHHGRAISHSDKIPSVGAFLYDHAIEGGRQSLGRAVGRIETGARADFVVLERNHPVLFDKVRDHLLDGAIFAGNVSPVRDVMVGGKWVVRQGRHEKEESAFHRYCQTLEKIRQ